MKVRVLFFGATADAAGTREIKLGIASSETLGELVDGLRHTYPLLEKMQLRFAVNEEYVEPDRRLEGDDDVALFTAVSGG